MLKVIIVKDVEHPTELMTVEEQLEIVSNEDGTMKEEAKRVAPFAREVLEVAEVGSIFKSFNKSHGFIFNTNHAS